MRALRPVSVLLVAIFILMAGGGSLSTLISVQLQDTGRSPLAIGAVTTAYFIGLTIGSLTVQRIISRVGHIRAFTAFVSTFSASVLTYALHTDAILWSGLRLVEGFCIAGVYVCLESWLNDKAPAESRGSVLAFYMVALYAGQAAGQFLLTLGGSPALPFVGASILLSLAVVPIALTRQAPPEPPPLTTLNVKALYQASPLGMVGAIGNGVMLGAFYGFGAVFMRAIGLSVAETALFMSAAILGGVALQYPLGKLSDVMDRRLVITGVVLAIAAVSAGLALSAGWPSWARLLAAAGFGGGIFALYPLCVAHTNDRLSADERVAASGGLVLAYSAGAVTGPMVASVVMAFAGESGVFFTIAGASGLVFLYALLRMGQRQAVPNAEQHPYLNIPRTTPAAAAMDPLAEEEQIADNPA